ncbi:MAG: hypothetical protein HPY57_14570 [Ignavibacteria bacterium]|nr:hypothetical protein [Ignavibacteria bacterium]
MKYLFTILLILYSFLSYCQGNTITDLVIKGNFEISIFQGDSDDMYIHAPIWLTKSIKTDYRDGVYFLENTKESSKPVEVYLVVRNLKSIKASGNVTIKTPTNLFLESLKLDFTEKVNATIFVTSQTFNLDIKGDGNLFISGEIDTINIKCSNSSYILAGLKCFKINITIKDDVEFVLYGTIQYLFLNIYDFTSFDNSSANCGVSTINSYDSSSVYIKSEELYLYSNNMSTIVYDGVLKDSKSSSNSKIKIKN